VGKRRRVGDSETGSERSSSTGGSKRMAKGNVCLAAGMSRRDRSNPHHEGVDATAWPCNGKERGRRRRSISPAWLKTQRDHGAGLPIDAAGTVRRCSGASPEVSSAPSRVFPRPADHDGMRRRGLHTYQKFAADALLRPFLRRSRFRQRLSPNVGLTHRERAHRLSAPLPRSQSTLQHLPSC
jgi:hypothetical protein